MPFDNIITRTGNEAVDIYLVLLFDHAGSQEGAGSSHGMVEDWFQFPDILDSNKSAMSAPGRTYIGLAGNRASLPKKRKYFHFFPLSLKESLFSLRMDRERAIRLQISALGQLTLGQHRIMPNNSDLRAVWTRLAPGARYSSSHLAVLCGLSIRQLEREFLKETGKTPRFWLCRLRCKTGLELIEKGYSTKAAAAQLFYRNAAHFCHQFKRTYGVPPQTFNPAKTGVYLKQRASPSLRGGRIRDI